MKRFCGYHVIEVDVGDNLLTPEDLEKGTSYIKGNLPNIKFGDIVHFKSIPSYRNDGDAIWDGEKLIPLDEEDEYGNLPPIFKICTVKFPRFHPTYWHGDSGIYHNGIVHFDVSPFRNECYSNIRYDTKLFGTLYSIRTHFILDGVKYYIVFDGWADDEVKGLTSDGSLVRAKDSKTLSLTSECDPKTVHELIEEFKLYIKNGFDALCTSDNYGRIYNVIFCHRWGWRTDAEDA